VKAFLFATGEHDNLHPLSAQIPSPMLPVANRPVMTYALELLIRHQVKEIAVSLWRGADHIEAYLETGRRWNVNFHYLLQRRAYGNAGAMKRAQGLLQESFLLLPGDALVDVDLSELWAFHRAHGGIATAVMAPRLSGSQHAGSVRLDARNRIQLDATAGDDPAAGLSFTQAFIFEPDVLEFIPKLTAFDCATDLMGRLVGQGETVYGYPMQGYWNPLDSFARYQAAQQDYLHSLMDSSEVMAHGPRLRHPYVEAAGNGRGIWQGYGAMVHPSAQINGPVYIGAGCQVGRDVTLGPHVVLGPNSIVDEGATVAESTILPDTYIGKWVKVEHKLVRASTLIDIRSAVSVEVEDRILLGNAGTQTANFLLHGLMERAVAVALLMLMLPYLVGVALLTRLLDGASAFVRTARIGRTLRAAHADHSMKPTTILLYRLRTRHDDGRPTRLGPWLEKWGLYRLPELFNVCRGDLALVGVKPLTEEEAALLSEAWHYRRFDCPAGFTGRWYTEVDGDTQIEELLVADAFQAAMRSTGDAWQQLLQTPRVWWHRRKGSHALVEPVNVSVKMERRVLR
jgi:NDP-sugar pyrophosphorylase family protein